MNRLFEKASRMLRDNRRRHSLLGLATVVGAAVAVVCTALLMYPAHALTGGDALRNAINDDSAVFWRPAGADDSAWSKADGSSAVDADAELRLRVAFTLPAGTLANGTTLQYKVPSSVHPDTSAGAIEGGVYASPTVGDPSRNGANAIGTYSLDSDVLTLTFNEDVATANAGSAAGDGASDASADAGEKTASALNGYVDLDLGFDQLTCDDSGLATIELNDAVSLKVAKAAEEEASDQSADDSTATATVEVTTDDEQDSAGVESMSLLAKAAPAANSTSLNYPPFDEYITSVSVEKQDANHQYKPATEFTDGDDVRAVFDYSIDATKITEGNNIFQYQIPTGLRPTEPIGFDTQKTLATEDGTVYGTYTISKDGLIRFTFNDKAISYTDTIDGTLNFTGKVSNDGGGESSQTSFPGNSKTITVKKKESGGGDTSNDVNVKKTAALSDDQKTITYKVTVSSKNGTSGKVNITDSLDRWNTQNAKPTYNESSLSLQKFSAGSTTGTAMDVSSYIPQGKTSVFNNNSQSAWENGSSPAPSISLSNLPQLKAGESYELSYTVDLNATGKNVSPTVNNSADAGDDGGNKGQDNSSVHYEQAVKKSGTFRKEDDSIVWTIDVDPKGKDITSWSVTDTLPANTKLTKYVVRGDDGFTQTFDQISNPARLDFSFANLSNLTAAQKKQAYHIDIYTDASAAQNGNISNTATVTTDTDSIDVPATNPVYINHRTTQISKNYVKAEETQTKGIRKVTWSSNITLPAGNLKTFTFTDTIADAVDSEGVTIDDSHYATAADLESAFKSAVSGTSVTRQGGLYINVDNNARYLYTGIYDASNMSAAFYSTNSSDGNALSNDVHFSVTYFDKDGKIIPADDTKRHVKKFAVMVTITDGASVKALSMQTGEYPTYADTSKLAEGKSVTYKNNVAVGDDVTNSAKFDYTKPTQPKRIQKEVMTGDHSYSAGTGTNPVKFDLDSIKDGKLTYRITLTPTASDNGNIQIEDYLPKGMSYVDGSTKARFNEWYDDGTFTGGNAPTVSQKTQDDGSTKLTFTIPNYKYDSNKPNIYLYYDVSIKSDPSWNNGSTSKTYNNTAKWGTSESTHSTKVDRNLEVVSKDGEQLYESNEPTNTLRYYVEINPGCKDLDSNSDELTLTDTFNSNGIDSDLDPSSIKLYAYDYSKTHHFDPDRPITNYSATYDAKTHTITVKVPDKVACVLTYEYTLDNSFGTGATVSNNATLNGKNSTSKTVSLKEASSSGSVRLARLVLYKVDANDFSKTLSGVKFTLSYWDGSQWVNKTTSKDLVTDDQGSISYDYQKNVDKLSLNTLYRLSEVESTAPAGYAGGAEHFFIVKQVTGGTTLTDDEAFSKAEASNATNKSGGTLTVADVDFFKDNKTSTMYVTNEYTRLTAKKAWTDENGVAKDAPADSSAKLALYRYTKKVDSDNSVNVTVTAKGNQDWSTQTKLTGNRVSDGTVAIKKGSDFTFSVGGLWGGCSFDVYVNGQKYGDTQSFISNSPVTVTVGNVTADTTIEVKQNVGNSVSLTEDSNSPWVEPPQILDDAAGVQVGEAVDVSASSGWAYSWDNLPKQVDGKDVYYAVKELSYTVGGKTYEAGTGSYDVSYVNDDGIQTGTITVTNSEKKNQGYELPSTGGTPSPLPWVGGTLAALAGVLLVRRMRPRRS